MNVTVAVLCFSSKKPDNAQGTTLVCALQSWQIVVAGARLLILCVRGSIDKNS